MFPVGSRTGGARKLSTRFISVNTDIHSCLCFLDTLLQAYQIRESSSFFSFKRFHQPRKPDLLIHSQIMIERLLCARPHAGNTTSFCVNKRTQTLMFVMVLIFYRMYPLYLLAAEDIKQSIEQLVGLKDSKGFILQGGHEGHWTSLGRSGRSL